MAICRIYRHKIIMHDFITKGIIVHGLYSLFDAWLVRLHVLVVVNIMLIWNILESGIIL